MDTISTASAIILMLAIAWFVQYLLSFYQLRRFYRRIHQLRRLGTVSIGAEGTAWKRRQYAVLVVDPERRILHAEQLSGWTVAASLKPVPGLEGRPMSDLLDGAVDLPVSGKLLMALRDAVRHIQEAEEKALNKGATAIETILEETSA